jgi:hypothetical protein
VKTIIGYIKADLHIIIVIGLIVIGIFIALDKAYPQALLDKNGNELPPTTIAAEDIPEDTGFVPVKDETVAIPSTAALPVVELPKVEIPAVYLVSILTPEIMATLFDDSLMASDLLNSLKWPVTEKLPVVLTPLEIIREISLLEQFGISRGPVFETPVIASHSRFASPLSPLEQSYDVTPKFNFKEQFSGIDKNISDKITSAFSGIKDQQAFIKEDHPKNFIGDKRTVQHMPAKEKTLANSAVWKAWKAVYAKDYPRMKYVRVPDITQIKMIAEMQVAKTQSQRDNLFAELSYFKKLGYNAVLAVWEGDKVSDFTEQITIVRGMGFKVFFTFGTKESLSTAIFIDPAAYSQGLATLAANCDGYLIGWRRTSLHLFNPDQKWIDFSVNCVRQGNPDIPVFGEVYRGFAGNNNPDGSYNENEFLVNIPTNASGAFVVNFGFQGVRPDGVLKLVRAVSDVPLIALIVGERPYYMTRNGNKPGSNGKTKAQNREIITRIENRFHKFDFGIATLAGDGSNGNYDKSVSDDLCKSQWSK